MISIIIPLYNKESTIKDSLHTILSQDFLDYEVVIIDDGSTDKSLERINEIRDSRIKVYRKSNGGPSSARNYGVKKAQGEWIVFLDADDSFLPGALMHFDSLIKSQNGINCFVFNFVCRKNKKDLSFSHITSSKILKNNFFLGAGKNAILVLVMH